MRFTAARCACVTASSSAQHSLARKARGHAALCPPGDTAPTDSSPAVSGVRSFEEEKLCLNTSPRGKLPHRHLLQRARDRIRASSLGIPKICCGAGAGWEPPRPPQRARSSSEHGEPSPSCRVRALSRQVLPSPCVGHGEETPEWAQPFTALPLGQTPSCARLPSPEEPTGTGG